MVFLLWMSVMACRETMGCTAASAPMALGAAAWSTERS
jgi:hypothetical protein